MPRKCINNECNKHASCNYPNEKGGLYCATHKLYGMVNVTSKKCAENGCNKIPYFNYPNKKGGMYCANHKLDEMVDVLHKKCLYNGCSKRPYFNYPNELKGDYCSLHKLDGMVDICSKRCMYKDCTKYPSYNYPGKNERLYCPIHALEGMIDVKHKKCIYKDCTKYSSYNYPHENNGLYCPIHALEGMIDVKNKICIYNGCNKYPSYNYPRKNVRLYCSTHALEGMIDIKSKRCKMDECDTMVTNKYKGYCLRCFIYLFPNEKNARNYKTKEVAVADLIKDSFKNIDIVCDKRVEDGCSRYRPDITIDLGYQVLLIEVDETQHKSYSCENKRIMTISQDIYHRPLIVLRFNPDTYHDGEKKVTSCWGNDGNGICVVKKCKKKEWENRCSALLERISFWLDPKNKMDKTLHVEQLFYDVE